MLIFKSYLGLVFAFLCDLPTFFESYLKPFKCDSGVNSNKFEKRPIEVMPLEENTKWNTNTKPFSDKIHKSWLAQEKNSLNFSTDTEQKLKNWSKQSCSTELKPVNKSLQPKLGAQAPPQVLKASSYPENLSPCKKPTHYPYIHTPFDYKFSIKKLIKIEFNSFCIECDNLFNYILNIKNSLIKLLKSSINDFIPYIKRIMESNTSISNNNYNVDNTSYSTNSSNIKGNSHNNVNNSSGAGDGDDNQNNNNKKKPNTNLEDFNLRLLSEIIKLIRELFSIFDRMQNLLMRMPNLQLLLLNVPEQLLNNPVPYLIAHGDQYVDGFEEFLDLLSRLSRIRRSLLNVLHLHNVYNKSRNEFSNVFDELSGTLTPPPYTGRYLN